VKGRVYLVKAEAYLRAKNSKFEARNTKQIRSKFKIQIAKLETDLGLGGGLYWLNIANSRFKMVQTNVEISVQSSIYGL
jgi:hypothetical protein